jgi:CheY-like chemotaxis protein
MKLLIIAGPYEADRIRKAALSAGFETVAVEPGESLSGWITASRPELIVMAPQIVHVDPAMALAKVRAVPRGRVPIFLVGDAADEARLRELADGFFVRPIAPELLLERARAILNPTNGEGRHGEGRKRRNSSPDLERTEMGVGPSGEGRRRKDSGIDLERTEMGVGPSAQAAPGNAMSGIAEAPVGGGRRTKSGPHPTRPAGASLKPLVAAALGGAPVAPVRPAAEPAGLLAELGAGIDALLDAELDAALAGAGKARGTDPLAKLAATPSPARQPVRPAPDFAGETTKKVEPALLGLVAKAQDNGRARILARYAPVEEGDYFAVLGVARGASAGEVRRAHQEIARETAPGALDPTVARELAVEIEAIRTVAGEAVRVLSDDNLRPRYESHLPPVGK